MCFIIAVVGIVLGIQFFLKSLYLYAFFAAIMALFFIAMMIKNILHVKKMRSKTKDIHDN
jgi:hypothetical protein